MQQEKGKGGFQGLKISQNRNSRSSRKKSRRSAILAVRERAKGRQSAAARSVQRRGFRSENKAKKNKTTKKKLKILHNLFL